jgi:hypothetical protein
MDDMPSKPTSISDYFELLQLPESLLSLALQKSNTCTLASSAVSCNKLKQAALAAFSKVEVHCTSAQTIESLSLWLAQNRTSLTNITYISIAGDSESNLTPLPNLVPQLQHLQLRGLRVQLMPSNRSPGVLHECSCLTALDLQDCRAQDADAAFATIAALPDLQSLRLLSTGLDWQAVQLSQLQSPLQLTSLSLGAMGLSAEHLSQLSALANLGHLQLHGLPPDGVTGGVPSQVGKLTSLEMQYKMGCSRVAEQLQHLSSLTALQQLTVDCDDLDARGLSGLKHISQLTSLAVHSSGFDFSSSSTQGWPFLTGLQSLVLSMATAEPEVIGSLTQLRSLSLAVDMVNTVPLETLLLEVLLLTVAVAVDWAGPESTEPSAGQPSCRCLHSTHSQHQLACSQAELA